MPEQTELNSKTIRVGIDFGTTHTIVSLVDEGKHPILALPFDYGEETLVSDHVPTRVTMYNNKYF